MNLLVVTRTSPFPPRIGSAIVAYNNIKEISKKHSIYLICIDAPKDGGDDAEFVERIEFVGQQNTPKFLKVLHSAFYMLLGVPRFVSSCASNKMHKRMRQLVGQDKYDAILLYEMDAIQYFPPALYKKMVVNIEDPQFIKLYRMCKLPMLSPWEKVKLYVDAKVVARYEEKYLPRMAKVVVLSEEDAKDLREQNGYDNIGCVSYGVYKPSQEQILGCGERIEGMIILSGSMFHLPNVDGAVYFLKEIFPIVLMKCPDWMELKSSHDRS